MKLLTHLMCITTLLILVSCGAQKTATTLKVSSGMALSNSSYPGGLVFYGQSTTGKRFSAPVGITAGGVSNQVEIVLDKGIWSFGAVGWAGSNLMEGAAECAVLAGVNIDTNDKTINLDLNTADCSLPAFGGNIATAGMFKPLGLVTCGALFSDSGDPDNTTLLADNTNFCTSNTLLDPDLKIHAKSAKISLPQIIPEQPANTNSPIWVCVNLLNGQIPVSSQRLPSKNLPVRVELYEKTNCADKVAQYELFQGLDFTYSNFDHKYFTATNSNLYLLASISRRGTSSLMASLPSFKCDSATPSTPCIKLPKTVSYDRYISPNHDFYFDDSTTNQTCLSMTTISVGANNVTAASRCEERDGRMILRLNDTDFSACSTTCSLTATFTDTTTITKTIENAANPSDIRAYDFVFRAIGHEDVISVPLGGDYKNGFNSLALNAYGDKDDSHYGLLSSVREMFNPDAVGGLMLAYTTAATLTGKSVNVSVWEDGVAKSYNVSTQPDLIPVAVPAYMSVDTNSTSTATLNFTHKITISRIVGPSPVPEQIIRFVYGSKIGMLENKHVDSENGELRTEKEIIYWNTNNLDHSRIESYRSEKVVQENNQSIVLSERTSYTRAEREATALEKNAKIDEFSFESMKSGSTYDERSHKKSVSLKDNRLIFKESASESFSEATRLNYFNNYMFTEYNKSQAISDTTAFAKSGNFTVTAFSETTNGTSWNLKIIRTSAGSPRVIETVAVGSQAPFTPKVSINNAGHVTIAWVKLSTLYYVYAMTWDGSDWISAPAGGSAGANNQVVTSGVISPPSSIDNHSAPLLVDVVDNDAGSNSSDKALIYTTFDFAASSGWEMAYSRFSGGSWTASSVFANNGVVAYQPTHMKFVKGTGNDFLGVWTFWNTSDHVIKTLKTTNFGTPSPVQAQTFPVGTTPDKLITKYDGTDLKIAVLTSNPTNSVEALYSLGTLSALSGIPGTKRLHYAQTPHCFERSTATSQAFGALAQTTGCVQPDTSYVMPIKSAYKYDIESLHPSIFNTIFEIQ